MSLPPQEPALPRTDHPAPLPPTATVDEAPVDPARTVDRADAGTHLAANGPPPTALGRFALSGEIGRGGMGCVLRGHDPDLDRDLAIKILLPAHRGHAELERRFLEEARIAGRLEHPGIPPVHELGRAEDGRPFFVMKLIRGQTLTELLRERNVGPVCNRPTDTAGCKPAPQDLSRFLAVFEQVCQTLAYAHAHGVIHRDLKPANVMVGKFGEVQVMDWGLAKVLTTHPCPSPKAGEREPVVESVLQPTGEGLSQAGSVLGTPAYMAPEQARGQIDKLDERADVFGLGAILCTILTGSPPFLLGESSVIIRRAARGELGEAFSRLDGCGGDGELVALAKHCLAPEAGDRPRNAGEVATRVTAYRAGVEYRLREAEVQRAAAQARAEEAKAKVRAEKRARRLTLGLALAGLMLLALAGGGFGWWWMQRSAMVHDVEMALADARTLMEHGRWPEARAALERAAGRLDDGGPDQLHGRVRQARADVAVVGELEEIRLRQAAVKDGHFDNAAADPLYADAFWRYGLDVAALEESEALLRASAVREALLTALQHWASITRDADIGKRLYRLLEQADDDDWRRRFRALWARTDANGLKAMARQEETLQQPATILNRLANTLVEMGLPDEAVRLLRLAQRRYPADFWINHDLGMALMETEKEEAVRFFTAAVALRPNSPGAYLNLGCALSNQGKDDEAIACYRQAIKLDPKYAAAHSNVGAILCDRKHNYASAIAAFRKAITLDPKLAVAHNNLGTALAYQGKLEEAIAAYRQAIALEPNYATAHKNRGNALDNLGKLNEAIASFRQAIKLDPKYVAAYHGLGNALSKQGKLDEVITCYHQAIKIDPKDVVAYHGLGTALYQQGKFNEAIAAFRLVVKINPKDAIVHTNLGNALLAQGKVDEAIAYYLQAITLDPKYAQAHFTLGKALSDTGKVDAAIARYRQAIKLDSKHPEAHCNLGLSLRDQGRLTESLESLRRGHALGAKRPGWSKPSARWVREGERLVLLEKQLPDVLSGKLKPASAAERIEYAGVCTLTKRYAAGVRMYAEAFTAEPKLADNLEAAHRYSAACYAALAGCGKGDDTAKFDDKEKARLRGQALAWLRADLILRGKQMESGKPAELATVQETMRHWQKDSDLAAVRDKDALAKLPEAERAEWRKLWVDVEALRKKAEAKPVKK